MATSSKQSRLFSSKDECIRNQARRRRYKFQTVAWEQQETACNFNLTPWHQIWVSARQAVTERFTEEPQYRE